MHGEFHPKSSTLRLYTKRKEGGRGVVRVRATIQDETTKIQEYIRKMVPSDELLSECFKLLKSRRDEEEEDKLSWKDKALHADSTEALIMAAQEQALTHKSIRGQGLPHQTGLQV